MQKKGSFKRQQIFVILFVLSTLFLSCRKETINHTFIFDNRKAGCKIESLAVAGDFNHWDKYRTALTDADHDDIWEVSVPLHIGSHYYRFVLNNKQWLRDPKNPDFGGCYSNSYIYIDKIKYPVLQKMNPASGSWLYAPPDSVMLFFNLPPEDDNFNIRLEIDGIKQQTVVKDSMLMTGFPRLFEGKHFWKLLIKNRAKELVYEKSGIWLVNYQNQKPRAIGGYTRFAFSGDSVRLNGGLSFDPDFEPLTGFLWRQERGPARVKLKNNTTAFPNFITTTPGKYRFSMTVRDSGGLQSLAFSEVIVLKQKRHFTEFAFNSSSFSGKVHSAALVGEFNQWDKNANHLQPNPDSTKWILRIPLNNGRYEYKYVINGQDWTVDPKNSEKISDGWNGFNSIIDIKSNPTFGLDFSTQPDKDQENIIKITANVQSQQKTKISWIADIQNPKAQFTIRNNTLYFSKKNPEGSYFFYCLAEQNDNFSHPRTLLINHYQQTTVSDFDAAPEWAEQAVVYEVYLRRFGARRNFRELTESLPKLKNLGVNVLWLMPVYEGPSEHGYAPTNLFATEKDYGSLEDYRGLIKRAHSQGFKVIFDFVANHVSDQHIYVSAAVDNPLSPLRKWFFWREDGGWGYHNDWDTLVNLNYGLPMVRHQMLDAARFWLGLGVDGFRCDVAWAVPHDFWKDFRREVKKINTDCLLINEVLPRKPAYHQQEFDMSYDTDFYGNLLDVMNGRKPLSALPYGLQKTKYNYPAAALNLRYLENHDLPRFIKQFGAGKTRLAAVILFTIPGAPLIYYGQENGVRDERPFYNLTTHTNWFDFYRSLIKFRLKNKALTGRSVKTLLIDDKRGLWIYQRALGDNEIQVAINLSKESRVINIPLHHSIVNIKGSDYKQVGGETIIAPESFLLSKKMIAPKGRKRHNAVQK